ncbi:hypothetical protein ACTMTI_00385 [Nonomuraea sp. H19]|uniref:hypothetical protein n=1 Tax=Nonomuraea sp. H19 TaxID=3452206 RepID=UPI003F8C0025
MTPDEGETDALLDALGRGEVPPDSGDPDPAVRLLAALVDDVRRRRPSSSVLDNAVLDNAGLGGSGLGEVGQRRSSVSMTPST